MGQDDQLEARTLQVGKPQLRRLRATLTRVIFLVALFVVICRIIWQFPPVKPYATLKPGECDSVLFSPDGSMLVTTERIQFSGRTKGPIRVWDVATGKLRVSLAHDWRKIETIHFSPDCTLIAAHEQEGDLKIWDTRTGQEIATFMPKAPFTNWVNFCFSPDGRFLIFQDYSKGWPDKDHLTFWNIKSRKPQGSIQSWLGSLAFGPGTSFATFRRKDHEKINEVLLWKLEEQPVLLRHCSILASQLAFSPDLKTFATADDLPNGNGEVSLWDMTTGKKRWSLSFDQAGTHVQTLSFLAGGRILLAHGGGGTGRLDWKWHSTLWDVSSSSPREIGSFSEEPVVSSDGKYLADALENGARLIRVSTPDAATTLIGEGDSGLSALVVFDGNVSYPKRSFSPDNRLLVVSDLHRWPEESALEKVSPQALSAVTSQYRGRIVRVWDAHTLEEVHLFKNCRDVWFSPDGKVLATLSDDFQSIELWKMPLRPSLWKCLFWAFLVWVAVVVGGWLVYRIWKRLFSGYGV